MTNTRPHVALDGQYPVSEVAMILGVNPKTIYRWRKCGYLKEKRHRYNKRPYILGREILKLFDLGL